MISGVAFSWFVLFGRLKRMNKKLGTTLNQRILDTLINPMQSEALRKKLRAPKSDFTRALNLLIKENKIMRSPYSKKEWARVI